MHLRVQHEACRTKNTKTLQIGGGAVNVLEGGAKKEEEKKGIKRDGQKKREEKTASFCVEI